MGILSLTEEKALSEFKGILNSTFGNNIKTLLLYGSKAKGTSTKESDIDVFVLIDKGGFEIRDQIVDIAYDLFLKYDILISPRVIDISEYNLLMRWKTSFIKNLEKDSIKI